MCREMTHQVPVWQNRAITSPVLTLHPSTRCEAQIKQVHAQAPCLHTEHQHTWSHGSPAPSPPRCGCLQTEPHLLERVVLHYGVWLGLYGRRSLLQYPLLNLLLLLQCFYKGSLQSVSVLSFQGLFLIWCHTGFTHNGSILLLPPAAGEVSLTLSTHVGLARWYRNWNFTCRNTARLVLLIFGFDKWITFNPQEYSSMNK